MSAISEIAPIMKKDGWMTIPDIQRRLSNWYMETTVSARIRDLRKFEYGCYKIERRRKKGSKLWEYRLAK